MKKKYKLEESDLTEADLEDFEEDYEPMTSRSHSGVFVALICFLLIVLVIGGLAGFIYIKEQKAAEEAANTQPADPIITIGNTTDLQVKQVVEDGICVITVTSTVTGTYYAYEYQKIGGKLNIRKGFTLVFSEPGSKTCEFIAENDQEYVVKIIQHTT